mgnify:CR=1 FL=1
MERIKDIGEFDLITRLENILGKSITQNPGGIHLSIGDDTAVLNPQEDIQLLTTDTMVENVHFLPGITSMKDLGWKSIASNYSDVASMGGRPLSVVITLGLKPNQYVKDVEDIYHGVRDHCSNYGGYIVGGDIVRSETFFISVTVLGVNESKTFMSRTNASPGDQIAVTGEIGSAAAGLELLSHGKTATHNIPSQFIAAHNRPIPKIQAGTKLLESGVKTAMDISDGLVGDLMKICHSSDVSATIELDRIPINRDLKNYFPDDWLKLVLGGGEDYELLFTAPEHVMTCLPDDVKGSSTIIGTINNGPPEVILSDVNGNRHTTGDIGWDHFQTLKS